MPGPGQESQSVITWPDGNGRVIEHFLGGLRDQIRCGLAVNAVLPDDTTGDDFNGRLQVIGFDTQTHQFAHWQAEQVIFAAPQMLARHLIRNLNHTTVREHREFQYGSWLVANVHLRDRPAEKGFPMCWDNVIQGSSSLGYVTATHQMGIDHGPTVLTWYHPFAEIEATETRKRMLELQWSDWAEFVVEDLQLAHPDIAGLITRIDIMLWGHAMIQPRVGFVWSQSRIAARKSLGSIHFAGTDLSGIALFEEAFHHGIRAAEEALDRIGYDHDSILPTQTDSSS